MKHKRSVLRKCLFRRSVMIEGSSPWEYEMRDFKGYFHTWVHTTEYGNPVTVALVENEDDMRLYQVGIGHIHFTEK